MKRETEMQSDMAAAGHDLGMRRLRVNGQSHFLKGDWVPASMREAQMLPEGLSSFGSAWILRQAEGVGRYGPAEWPFMGVGGFLLGLSGTTCVMTWPVQWWVDLGVLPEQATSRLERFSASDFKDLVANAPVNHAVLRAARAVWIPFGHAAVTVAMAPAGAASTLWLPFFSTTMVGQSPGATSQAVHDMMERFLRDYSDTLGPELSGFSSGMEWLRGLVQSVEDGSDSGGATPTAVSEPAPPRPPVVPMPKASLAPSVGRQSAQSASSQGPPPAKRARVAGTTRQKAPAAPATQQSVASEADRASAMSAPDSDDASDDGAPNIS